MAREWKITIFLIIPILLSGCASSHQSHRPQERKLTIQPIQKEVRRGITQVEMTDSLGVPTIVTKDNEGNETWIYNEIASEANYSHTDVAGTILLLGFSKDKKDLGESITVIINFDKQKQVESFSYHTGEF